MADSDALYLVDGSGFIFRAFHALPPLTTTTGIPSGAVYGFTTMLIKLEVEHRPSHLAVVWDAGARSFRNEMFAGYKADRKEPPDDLKPQFALVRRVVEAFGVPMMEAPGFEADDLIATLVRRAKERGMRVVIVSSDKDLMQLVDDRCVMVDTMKSFTYGPAEVEEKFGVPPGQVADVLALMGDSIDNVPGVPGVGPKTASALVRAFGSIEALLTRVDEVAQVPGLRGAASCGKKVAEHAEAIRLSRRLVELEYHVPTDVELESLVRRQPDMARVEAILRELEFGKLIERLEGKGKPIRPGEEPAPRPAARATTTTGAEPAPAPPVVPLRIMGEKPTRLVTTPAALAELVAELADAPEMSLAVQASGGPAVSAAIIGLAVATRRGTAYLPLGHRYLGAPPQLAAETVFAALGPVLTAARPAKHVHAVKDATVLLARVGVALGGVVSDPMISSYLLNPAAEHDLTNICQYRFGAPIEGRDAVCGSGKKAVPFDTVELERAARFAGCEAEATLELGAAMTDELEARGMGSLNRDVELPLAHVLAVMERHGVRIDVPALHRLGADLGDKLRAIESEVRALSGEDVNLGSPKQLQDLLFVKLGLPGVKRTKTGLSTDAAVLEELAPLHPVAAKILEHRQLSKLKGTYIDALPQLVDARSGRLHTSYRQTVAETGRLSSTDPNLQNVPIRTELGREIRRAFIADPGNLLVVADYSQIELRVLAHLSHDPVLIDAFGKDQDIHQRTVVEMFGADKEKDPDLRRVAKMINYGIVYGLSDYGLATRLGIDRGDAHRYIEGYLATYAGLARYMERLIDEARTGGGSLTILGRFRPLPELESRNRQVRQYGERMARNTPIQGSAADLLKVAMIAVQKTLDARWPAVRMLLTVHDELVLEAPEADAVAVGEAVKSVMETVMPLSVPLKVDLGVGRTWADAK